jgi:hypothetical protein
MEASAYAYHPYDSAAPEASSHKPKRKSTPISTFGTKPIEEFHYAFTRQASFWNPYEPTFGQV